jgi:hypothetical protein
MLRKRVSSYWVQAQIAGKETGKALRVAVLPCCLESSVQERLQLNRGPPLWSSGQSSWLQIRMPGFDSRHYHKKVVGLERGSLSLVSTTEALLDRKVAAPV